MFKLHVIQAKFGDSLLIEYGSGQSPRFLLIDGGPKDVFNESLRPVLDKLVSNHSLEAVMISHIDTDHIKGILDMLTELKRQQDAGEAPFIQIRELWLNSFTKTIDRDGDIGHDMNMLSTQAAAAGVQMASTQVAVNGVKEGHNVTRLCTMLRIPMNSSGVNGFYCVDTHPDEIKFDNLSFTIVGPTTANLEELQKEWKEWLRKRKQDLAQGTLDILKMADKSVPNLSSIAFLVKGDNRTILFTGDSRGDFLIDGLRAAGLLENEHFHCDVLKVQHHGSDRNADLDFFKRIKADVYVISADGKHDNPDIEMLRWIVQAAEGRPVEIVFTNRTGSITTLLAEFPPQDNNYKVRFIEEGAMSIEV